MYKLLIGLFITGHALAVTYECNGRLDYQGPHWDEARVASLVVKEEESKVTVAEIKFNYTSSARRIHMRMTGEVVPCGTNQTGCLGIDLLTQHDHLLFEIHPNDSRPDVLVHNTGHGIRNYQGKLNCKLRNR